MKRFLLFLIVLMGFWGYSQRTPSTPAMPSAASMKAGAFIDVNSAGYPESNYSVTQLITDVLISGGSNCGGTVSNVVVSPNLAASNSARSWGYFNKGTTTFPFDEGLVLVTGRANEAGNSYIGGDLQQSVPGSTTDTDLATALGVPSSQLSDATFIQFDFVPYTDQVTFNYIFASEEYTGGFPCQYSDGFALLLKPVGAPNYTNLAILPGGAGPISSKNIRPATQFNGTPLTCGPLNASYFGGYNTTSVQTNLNGRTIPLTATATVVPGQTYRFKMVIGDFSTSSTPDTSYDTAVFLQAGSFQIGTQLTDNNGNPLPPSVDICQGESLTVTADVQVPGATFQWYNSSGPISGQTTNTYTITQSGVYGVEVTLPGQGSTCSETTEITVNVNPSPTVQNASLSVCANSTTATFDLTSAQPNISTTTGATFKYYTTLAAAQAGGANNITNPTTYSSGNATIYVRVTVGNCSNIAELQLTVNQNPTTPTIASSGNNICGAGNITLTSSATSGNTWSTGETTQSIIISTAGTYTVTVSNGTCTSAPASITITGDQDPGLDITGNLVYCSGDSTILTASTTGAVNSYLWSTGATTQTITVTTPGTYTVTATAPNGCAFQDTVTVTENPSPVVQNANLANCSTGTTADFDLTSAESTISTSPGITFTYYTNLADAQAGNTNNIVGTTNYNSGTAIIYVRVSNANCYEIAELQLNVGAIPTPIITQSAPAICAGTPVTLTSNYPTGNQWSNGATTQSITVSTAGTYTLIVSQGNCTSDPASVTLESTPDPNVQISGATNFCQGSFTTLTANATGTGNTYLWSNGSTTQSIDANVAGTYTVTVTTPSGCEFQDNITVTMEPEINIVIAQPAQITCTDPTITLNASGSTFQSSASIQWTTAGGNIVSGATTLNPVVDQGGTYTLTITNSTGLQCSQQETVTVVENNANPVITIAAPAASICEGESIVLTASGAQTYTWTGLTGTGPTQTVSPTTTTTYTVTGVGANGCQGNSASITIDVVPAIVSTLSDIEFCEGDSGVLDAGAGPNYTYLWSTGATSQTITVTDEGIYTVTIDNGTCSQTYSANVSYTVVPEFKEIIFDGNTLTIELLGAITSSVEYSIDGGLTWQDSNVFYNVQQNTMYNIYARVKDVNCYGQTEYFTFFMYNFISPNDDGYNDYVDLTTISKYPNFNGAIYDRYGLEVFKAAPGKTVWRGDYINQNLPTGTYWYVLSWTDPISKKLVQKSGWILLKNRKD